eukprot:PITA_19643
MKVYGPQRMDDKVRFIGSLVDLRARYVDIPWILGGDFNMIKSLSEKKGGTKMLNIDSLAFQAFMYSMKLVDIVSSNGLSTWNNKRGGDSLVASKLDRFIILEDLILNNKEIATRILPFGGSDHWPVQLELKGIGTPSNRPFRFENMALPSRFHQQHFRLVVGRFTHSGYKNEKSTKLQQEWENFCKQEEIFWRQKSRVQWLKEGERNTRFFHRSTLANKAHNRISSIKDEGGKLLSSHEDIEVVLVRHFRGIAKENILDREHFIKVLTRHIPRLVSREDNFNLNRPVTKEEISDVLKEMQNGKAPGPDGFNVDFFKSCWNIVKQDTLNVVEDSRRNRTILKALNTSFISLIPKEDNSLTPNEFRPIAFCNVVYKIISKVVSNRLKPLLPTLVFGEQSGYVEGRKILNNIIQAHEVRWVMALVTSPSFSILVNGSPFETFIPSRGLRQGDPLSPFLFIVMMEGLGRSIKQAKEDGKIKGLQLYENGQSGTHQQFVDDTMLRGIPTGLKIKNNS